ncbi:MAG: hypothetical protein K6T83_05545 [Alicyclobacillus sp.]|nr:hypothetical protein [Alicyclobacillus sp.]
MRLSHVTVDLDAQDLNDLLAEFLPHGNLRVSEVRDGMIRGQVRLLWWHVDFTAKPSSIAPSDAQLDITASKVIPIPASIVQKQLKEAMRDAPPGVDVLRQSLRVHVPSLLSPFGISVQIDEFAAHDGYVRVKVRNLQLPDIGRLLKKPCPVSDDAEPSMRTSPAPSGAG